MEITTNRQDALLLDLNYMWKKEERYVDTQKGSKIEEVTPRQRENKNNQTHLVLK